MALKSDQANVLRRRVLGTMARNLALFSLAFLLCCAAFQAFAVPPLAAYVADSTSSWRTLNSSSYLEEALTESGLWGGSPVDDTMKAFQDEGYSDAAGSITAVVDELNALTDAIEAYAEGTVDAAEMSAAEDAITSLEQQAAGASDKDGSQSIVDAEAAGNVIVSSNGTYQVVTDENGSAGTDNADAVDGDADEAGIADEPAGEPVPFISYEDILAASGTMPTDASAAQGLAAVSLSAIIQERRLTLTVPAGAPDVSNVAVLAHAAAAGYDEETLRTTFAEAYRQSQDRAHETWCDLPPEQQAQQLGVNDSSPVWQVEQASDGTFQMRDIALYTFVKSFKMPLAILVFVVGWLLIVLRALNQSLRYFDELSGAVGRMLADKNAPIELPPDLSIARNELAVIRSQSLADERAAKAAEQRKNELVAYLAHDIRTPLTSVLGYLDLLREATDLPRDTLRKYADVAYTKAERLESLINEFFEITRYNLSAIPIERETVGVRLFCQQVAEAFFPEASARSIRISVDVPAGDTFFVDPDKMARALGNVLRNAVAYAETSSTIALAARQDEQFTTITVANRGREISEAHLESIFEKFYREDGARTTRSGGAGLGLAIAKEIVVAHQGDIEAASQRGVTVFSLRLPTRGATRAVPLKPRYTHAPTPSAPPRMHDNRPRSRSKHARRKP
ncbi:HAMP domain-containing sensor histidine kinase [Adlercreutzia sp. R21]|uniref:sensor histidine kinase n=1 Tax=Adlercreutzia wanghongyangiae TaxID=3111451 RepID=UPI002DB6A38A|nr:HAMP domain-containing sensor histidine kinase [Adlercreutzia sp. R21]MEC4184799.1 HAMP domain-containing sensor histidine kinase [Adlercreutzia sp. R21]